MQSCNGIAIIFEWQIIIQMLFSIWYNVIIISTFGSFKRYHIAFSYISLKIFTLLSFWLYQKIERVQNGDENSEDTWYMKGGKINKVSSLQRIAVKKFQHCWFKKDINSNEILSFKVLSSPSNSYCLSTKTINEMWFKQT